MIQRQGYFAEEKTLEILRGLCEKIYKNRNAYTGNARRMERLLEDMNVRRRRRCYAQHIDITSREGKTFVPEDTEGI